MHEADRSRIITTFSRGVPKNQVLMLPYSDEIRHGSKTIPFVKWKDVHASGGPCHHLDDLCIEPLHFNQRSRAQTTRKSSSPAKHSAWLRWMTMTIWFAHLMQMSRLVMPCASSHT
jgi:hypothetical protein